jgi:hypothetical protein
MQPNASSVHRKSVCVLLRRLCCKNDSITESSRASSFRYQFFSFSIRAFPDELNLTKDMLFGNHLTWHFRILWGTA